MFASSDGEINLFIGGANMDITIERQGSDRGRYLATLEGKTAEMTFQRSGEVMVIDHTGVPADLEGRGVGKALVERAVSDARAEGFKIKPRCSFVVALFQRRSAEWADVFA
jgi:hypothetical protein